MAEKSATKFNVLDATQKVGEQLVGAVKQTQGLTLDVARAFAETVPPVPARLPEAPTVAVLPDVQEVTAYGFDLAAELLGAQKDFVVSLASTFAPAKKA